MFWPDAPRIFLNLGLRQTRGFVQGIILLVLITYAFSLLIILRAFPTHATRSLSSLGVFERSKRETSKLSKPFKRCLLLVTFSFFNFVFSPEKSRSTLDKERKQKNEQKTQFVHPQYIVTHATSLTMEFS